MKKNLLEIAKLEAEIAKATADREKAELEARDLRRIWFLRPGFFQPISTLLIAAMGVGAGFYTGLFETRRQTLELKEAQLEKKIAEREDEHNQLRLNNASLQEDTKRLADEVGQLKKTLQDTTRKLEDARKKGPDAFREQVAKSAKALAEEFEQPVRSASPTRCLVEDAVTGAPLPGVVISVMNVAITSAVPIKPIPGIPQRLSGPDGSFDCSPDKERLYFAVIGLSRLGYIDIQRDWPRTPVVFRMFRRLEDDLPTP